MQLLCPFVAQDCVSSSGVIISFVQWLIGFDQQGPTALLPRADGFGLSKAVCEAFRNFPSAQKECEKKAIDF